jgi:hypothetical protein
VRVAAKNRLLWDIALAAAGCAAVATLVCAGGVRAAESVASNLDLMTQLTADIAGEMYGKFGASVGERPVEVRPYGTSEDYVFVTNVFTGELTRAGVRTIRGARPLPPQGAGSAALDSLFAQSPPSAPYVAAAGALVLQFQNIAFSIAYPDVYRSHAIGGKKIRRTASVRVFATLSDGDSGEVLWTGEAERTRSDEFDQDDSARVESGTYAFVRPIMPTGGLGKYAEPVFVTAIVVGLIYLFFSNQSDN